MCSTGRVLVSGPCPFVKTARLPRGSRPQVQSGERVEASSTIPPAYTFFAQPRLLLTVPPRGRDPATQQILIDCDSSVQGKRSCQALETNSNSGAQKTQFPWLLFDQLSTGYSASAGAGCDVAAHTNPQLTHRFGCVDNLGPRLQPRTPATGHRLFASAPRLPSFDVDANPSAVTARNELSFGSSCHPCLLRATNAPAPGACWRAARQESICLR